MEQYWMDRCQLAWGNGPTALDLKPGVVRGSWLVEAPDFATWTQLVDGMGNAIRNYMPGTSGAFTLQIYQTSTTHKKLKDVHELDRQTRIQVFPCVLHDEATGETVTYSSAYIMSCPPLGGRAMEAAALPWIFGYGARLVTQPAVLSVVGS